MGLDRLQVIETGLGPGRAASSVTTPATSLVLAPGLV